MSLYKKCHRWFHQFASPKYFYDISHIISKYAIVVCIICFIAGLYGGLILAPADYQQGDSFRIMYVHVPAAWMALFVYVVMAVAGGIGLIWHIKLAEIVARNSAPIGASFTFLALVSGAIWGKPMWGAYWVWDARLTSFLILFFLYLGYIALQSAFEDRRVAARAGAILALVGIVNIPIIHYSVEWWSTLHQGSIISQIDKPTVHMSMLIPLIFMVLAFKTFYVTSLLIRVRTEILEYESNTSWVKQLLRDYKNVTN
ncbi:MAG TPA: heme ABC transporter permease [Thiotrichaceae bacterium]|jgi:heme exporter protein C|nr:heme ABC transporter permease [Thiotrichaceae bacterium]HIM07867.1 heme ABC transporter permease [Gammaproteobacteria bacterium]